MSELAGLLSMGTLILKIYLFINIAVGVSLIVVGIKYRRQIKGFISRFFEGFK